MQGVSCKLLFWLNSKKYTEYKRNMKVKILPFKEHVMESQLKADKKDV